MRTFQISLVLFCLLSACADRAPAQLSFSDSSRLRDPAFLSGQVQEISDTTLWQSLDLSRPRLDDVRSAARAGRFEEAARAWGVYWAAKAQPVYITRLDHLLLDTDLLMPADSFAHSLAGSPEERDSIVERAGLILRNIIRTWGDSTVAFGDSVDFNREIGTSGKYGFHYWLWSRPLLMAAVLTGDRRYLGKFDQLFTTWYIQRNRITRTIPSLDPVYYELGLGVRNRLFIEFYLLARAGCSPRTHERILKTVLGAGHWLYELQRWEGYRPGNWQIHGSYMLVQLALAFPEFRESGTWLAMGLQRMSEHLERDFFADGGHSERCPRNYTLATYLSFRNLAFLLASYGAAEGVRLQVLASMGRTIDWWLAMLAPTGEVPAINDSHRGLFPAMILKDGAAIFRKPEARRLLHDLLGAKEGAAGPLPPFTSRHMPASGFTVMRSDWTSDALYMTLNYGPHAGSHTHADLLGFELYAHGKPLALDAGIGMTYDDPLYIPWYRSTRAHNTVLVNDSTMRREGFQGESILWGSTGVLEYFAGEHRGYKHLGVRHRRQVAFVKPSYWFVLDDIHCARSGDTLSWYFHTPEQLAPYGNGFASSAAPGIRILPAGTPPASRRGEGWAAATGERIPGRTELLPWIRFDRTGVKDSMVQFALLLDPFKEKAAVRSTRKISDRHYLVSSPGVEDHLYFPGGTGSPGSTYTEGGLETDGVCVLISLRGQGSARFAVVNGTYLRYGGRTLWHGATVSSGEGQFTP